MATVFQSGQKPKSKIIQNSFNSRLSSLFGWKSVTKDKAQNQLEKDTGIKFVKVDTENPAYRIKNAALGNVFKNAPLAQSLDKYFNNYLNETTLVYSDIAERQQRLSELRFAVRNDPFLAKACRLVADEATQLDEQNRLLSIESPSIPFINRCYELFAQWGLTQQRIASVCYDLEQYGEAIWAHRISVDKGVERISALKVQSLMERLEFSPAHMAEVMAQLKNGDDVNKSRKSKIEQLMSELNNNQEYVAGLNEDFADTFDTKLLGYEFDDGIVVPPWIITHFRYQPDSTEFFPYGEPPLLMALAPFKLLNSTITLQGLARASSFPVQLYTVKQTEGVGVETAFETVNNVREEYDNIGVTPQTNSLEVYTVNTKIWAPEGLLDMKVLESKVDFDFTGDIELYEDRVAIASGVPKSYLDQEFGGFGNSGIALVEQYKPFARHVYTIQSAFLEGLGNLIRLHFAITGEFDYNIPFVLSMRFPAEEMGQEKRDARQASIDLSNSIIELLQSVLGLEEGEPLPEDVVSDILSKYTFLDPTDLERWVRLSAIAKAASADESDGEDEDGGFDDEGGGGGGGDDFDLGADGGGDEGGDEGGDDFDLGGDEGLEESMSPEERKYYLRVKQRLVEKMKRQNKLKKKKIMEAKRKRLREVSQRYREAKEEIYFSFLRENHMTEWKRQEGHHQQHEMLIPTIDNNNVMFESFKVLSLKDKGGKQKLNEAVIKQQPLNNDDIPTSLKDIGKIVGKS